LHVSALQSEQLTEVAEIQKIYNNFCKLHSTVQHIENWVV